MDPRCRIYNDKFPLRIEPTLYSVPSIIYVPVNQRSQCGVCIADRDIIEIILRPFRWSNNSCNVFTQERIDARSQPPFSPLNVIINLGSEQCKRFFFFFFFSPFFPPHFLTLHCAELALESKDVPRRRSIGRGVFLFETRLFPNRAA